MIRASDQPRFTIASVEHRQVTDIAHPAWERRSAVEVGSQHHVVFTDELDRAIDDREPFVGRELEFVRCVDADHRELRRREPVQFLDRHAGLLAADVGGVPERLAGVLGPPVEHFDVVELVADLEPDHATFGRQLLQQRVRHVPRNVVETAQAVMRREDRIGARVNCLRDGLVRPV